MKCLLVVAASTLGFATACSAQLTCPEMPAEFTKVSRDVVLDVKANAGKLGKLSAAEVGLRTEVAAKAMFEKFPGLDRLLVLQMLSSTYCSALKSPDISAKERLDRWERFMERYLELRVTPPVRKASEKVGKSGAAKGTPSPPVSSSEGSKEKPLPAPNDDERYRTALASSISGNIESAQGVFRSLAERGHVRSQYQIGRAFLMGEGVAKDYRLAFAWLSKAAQGGIPAAQHNLAVMYQDGLGTVRDESQAQVWFAEAARGGFGPSRELLSSQGRSW